MLLATSATRPDGPVITPNLRSVSARAASPLAAAGRVVAAGASRLRMTANAVAMLAAAATSFGVVLLAAAPATLPLGAGVAALLGAGLVLDAAVAPLARRTERPTGLRLGRVAIAVALHAAVFVSAYRSLVPSELPFLLLLPVAFAVVAAGLAVLAVVRDARRRTARVVTLPVRRSPLLTVLSDGTALVPSFLLLGSAPAFLTAYGLLFATSTAALVLSLSGEVRTRTR